MGQRASHVLKNQSCAGFFLDPAPHDRVDEAPAELALCAGGIPRDRWQIVFLAGVFVVSLTIYITRYT